MRKRYLLIKVVAEKPLSREQFGNALIDSVRRNFGEIGLSRIDPRLVRYDADRSRAIVSCKRERVAELQASMTLISEASGTPIVPLVFRVSGTIKALGRAEPR